MGVWGLPGGSWAEVRRQMAAQAAAEPLLGGSWGSPGASWQPFETLLGAKNL